MEKETKICKNCQREFVIEPADFEFYEKIKVPAPTWCPECRLIRRLIFRNEHILYKRKDTRTGKTIFSTIPDSAPVKVYERDYWWSDNWDAMEYARDYDFNKPFFKQFIKLSRDVPWFSRSAYNLVNSDYSANVGDLKNCYLIFNSIGSEDCAYGVDVRNSSDSFDNYFLISGELCHQCFMVQKSYRAFFSSHCQNCQDIYFSQDLANCQNCFACSNLRNKQYHIFNKPYSKEEYFEKLKKFDISSYKNKEEVEKKARDFWLKFPHKFIHGIKNVNVGGDYINHSKNVFDSLLINNAEDCKYCFCLGGDSVRDSYDYSIWGKNAELIYDSVQLGTGASRLKFCYLCYPNCRDLQYCLMCSSSSNLFGCVGLRNKQYCIFNKQYTKEEYEELVPKIIEHMGADYGEFFPPELSPFAYNETIAQEYFPLTKEQAISKGFKWKDQEDKDRPEATIKADDLPDHIKDVKDDILNEVIECKNNGSKASVVSQCTGVFKIIPQELEFYRKMNLPLPRYCPNCRHYHRIQQRNPLKLYKRKCMNKGCDTEFLTTYAPDRPEIVYCEKCYLKEVV